MSKKKFLAKGGAWHNGLPPKYASAGVVSQSVIRSDGVMLAIVLPSAIYILKEKTFRLKKRSKRGEQI